MGLHSGPRSRRTRRLLGLGGSIGCEVDSCLADLGGYFTLIGLVEGAKWRRGVVVPDSRSYNPRQIITIDRIRICCCGLGVLV